MALVWMLFLLLDRNLLLSLINTAIPENFFISVVGILSLLMYLFSIMCAYEKAKATFEDKESKAAEQKHPDVRKTFSSIFTF